MIIELTKSIGWKTASLFFITCLIDVHSANGQYTAIPDPAFEAALIQLGIDNSVDHQVLTSAIIGLTSLDVSKKYISDLTGIKSFTSLANLSCYQNEITSLDLSGMSALASLNCSTNQLININLNGLVNLSWFACGDNKLQGINLNGLTALQTFGCQNNQLSSIDLSGLTALEYFQCDQNQLTSLDVSVVTGLKMLTCASNQITILNVSDLPLLGTLFCNNNNLISLDVSKNIKLGDLKCDSNNLTNLNLKNGTNTIMGTYYLNFRNNPSLSCIQVDNKNFSDTHWSSKKDATASYSNDCSTLGINEIVFEKMSIYPIPSKGELHIDNVTLQKATIYDASGKLVKLTCFDNTSNMNTLNLDSIAKGNYYILIEAEGVSITRQIILD